MTVRVVEKGKNSDMEYKNLNPDILKESIKTYMTVLDSFEKLENKLANEHKKRKPLLPPECEKYFEQRERKY